MFHQSETKSRFSKGERIAVAVLAGLAVVVSSRSLLGGPQADASRVDIGYAAIQTVFAASEPGAPERLTPGILVRIYSDKDRRESFAFSNPDGVAYVPLRPGHYCFEAFSPQGLRLKLTETQARCFDVRRNEDTQVGVELSPQAVSQSGLIK